MMTDDHGLTERCLRFVEKQSAGEWGEAIENEDAAELLGFVRAEIARALRTSTPAS